MSITVHHAYCMALPAAVRGRAIQFQDLRIAAADDQSDGRG
jgi:hypothetical protein